MSTKQLFREACLIQLNATCWGGFKALSSDVMSEIGDIEWVKGRKHLIHPELLNPIRAVIARSRLHLHRHALPFPLAGLQLVPKAKINDVHEALLTLRAEFQSEVQRFAHELPSARRQAQTTLGDLFNEEDYPVDVNRRFRFEWRFLTLDYPGKTSILPPALLLEEKRKFQTLMNDTRDLAIAALREEFSGLVSHMAERLSGTEDGRPKRFKASMLENLRGFLDGFEDRNIFEDEQMTHLVAKAREVIEGVSPDMLREDDVFRTQIANEMKTVETAILAAVEDLPRRRLHLAA